MNDGLKQRLIGALLLAGVAVIFVPGFFKEKNPYQVDTATRIPAQPVITPVVMDPPRQVANTDPAPEPETMFLPPSDQPLSDPAELDAAEASASSSVASGTAASNSSPEAAAIPEASVTDLVPGAWVVQVASLGKEESARALRDKLQARGYKAYVRRAETASGQVSRVFIGPKLDKNAAQAIKDEIDPVFKVNALVLQFKP